MLLTTHMVERQPDHAPARIGRPAMPRPDQPSASTVIMTKAVGHRGREGLGRPGFGQREGMHGSPPRPAPLNNIRGQGRLHCHAARPRTIDAVYRRSSSRSIRFVAFACSNFRVRSASFCRAT